MSIFTDKTYEEMDWLSQAIMPIVANVSKKLELMPDEYVLTKADLDAYVEQHSYYGIDNSRLLELLAKRGKFPVSLDADFQSILKCYKLQFNEGDLIDFSSSVIPEIKLVKVKTALTDKELREMMMEECRNIIYNLNHRRCNDNGRLNEILEILGQEDLKGSKSAKNKVRLIQQTWQEILVTDKWNIRSFELTVKATKWILEYTQDGSLGAFANFCKLKVMTHSGLPIYSMEEIS